VITARLYRGEEVKDVDPESISGVVKDPGQLLWVDVADPTEKELDCLQEQFSLHHLAMEDVRERFQRPKFEKYPTHGFVVVHTSVGQEVDFFVNKNWLISVREGDNTSPAWSVDSSRAQFDRVHAEEPTSGFLLYVLLDQIVDGYFDELDTREDGLEALEERVFADPPPRERNVQQELLNARRDLLMFRRSVSPMREVFNALLRKELEWMDDETLTHFQDVYDHVLRATDTLDSLREILGNVVDAHLAMVSNNMNRVMKKMTSWGAILLCSALVASIYGMNFIHMPELKWKYGYVYALGLMATIASAGYWYFKKKDWL
jgi:magnesium transporter